MTKKVQSKESTAKTRKAFHAEANRRLARMTRSGMGIPAEEVFAYLFTRSRKKTVTRPRPMSMRDIQAEVNAVRRRRKLGQR